MMTRFAVLAFIAIACFVAPTFAAISGCNEGTSLASNPVFNQGSKWSELSDETEFRRFRVAHVASSVPKFESSSVSGRGIVMAVANSGEVATAWAAIQQLRSTGSNTPVEVFHTGAIRDAAANEFESVEGVRVREFSVSEESALTMSGAIIASSFSDVLFMSPRTYAIQNPDSLFDNQDFQSSGLMMFPSLYKTSPSNPIWSILSTACVDAFEQTGAAAVVNKAKAWAALHVASHLRGSFYQTMLNGDDATLSFGALATSTPVTMATTSQPVGAQYTIAGERKFCAHSMVLSSGSAFFLVSQNNEVSVSGSNADSLSCYSGVDVLAVAHDDALIANIVRLQASVPEHTSKIGLQACGSQAAISQSEWEGYVGPNGVSFQWKTTVPYANRYIEVQVDPSQIATVYKPNCANFYKCAPYNEVIKTWFFNVTSPSQSANIRVSTPTYVYGSTTRRLQYGNHTYLRVVDHQLMRDECSYWPNLGYDSSVSHNIVNGGWAVVAASWRVEDMGYMANTPIVVRVEYMGPSSSAFSTSVTSGPLMIVAAIIAFVAQRFF